jgi:HD-GYP domain-containing protein (c-di-GMP phosphodiesterase class II)
MSRSNRPTAWIPALAGGLATLWYRERGARQSAERLAAATLETLMNAIDANDQVTGAHVRRTAAYSLCIAEALGLSDAERHKLERVALFHDVGKIHSALFDIVHEDTRLTPEERALVATHPQRGAEVLQPLAAFYPELPAGVLAHHERWDGNGYPNRLRGEAIPFYARIVAVADTFDAITHSRRYHHGEGFDRGMAVVREGRGTQFDPLVSDTFLSQEVLANVRRTLDGSTGEQLTNRPRARRTDRRSGEAESVADVRFRWRAPMTVHVDDASPSQGDASAHG